MAMSPPPTKKGMDIDIALSKDMVSSTGMLMVSMGMDISVSISRFRHKSVLNKSFPALVGDSF
jgi:hypothetical protein